MGQKRLGVMYKDFDRIDFDEKPAHQVTITQPFHIGVTEVTVAQYWQFDPGFKTSDAKSNPLYPRPSGGAGAEGLKKQILISRWGGCGRVEKANPYQPIVNHRARHFLLKLTVRERLLQQYRTSIEFVSPRSMIEIITHQENHMLFVAFLSNTTVATYQGDGSKDYSGQLFPFHQFCLS